MKEEGYISTEIHITKKDTWEDIEYNHIERIDEAKRFDLVEITDYTKSNTIHDKLLKTLKEMGLVVKSNKRKNTLRKKFKLTQEELQALSYFHKISVHANMDCFEEPSLELEEYLKEIRFIRTRYHVTNLNKEAIRYLKEAGIYKDNQFQYNEANEDLVEGIFKFTPRERLVEKILELRGPDLLYAASHLGQNYEENKQLCEEIEEKLPYSFRFSFSLSFNRHESRKLIKRVPIESLDKENNVIEIDFQKKERIA
tara:strand:+ start:25573 stop:26337 length:765 start_codon:yes stop_codon:yes gene_type:complete